MTQDRTVRIGVRVLSYHVLDCIKISHVSGVHGGVCCDFTFSDERIERGQFRARPLVILFAAYASLGPSGQSARHWGRANMLDDFGVRCVRSRVIILYFSVNEKSLRFEVEKNSRFSCYSKSQYIISFSVSRAQLSQQVRSDCVTYAYFLITEKQPPSSVNLFSQSQSL